MRRKRSRSKADNQDKLRTNLQFMLTQHIGGRHFRPSTQEELMLRLAIIPEQTELFAQVLQRMQEQGLLRQNSAGAWMGAGAQAPDYHEGVISFHPRGFAFVRLSQTCSEISGDVFIPASQTLNALPSDLVSIEITGNGRKGAEGRVVHIVKRGKNSLYGIILADGHGHHHRHVPALVPALSQHRLSVELSKEIEVRKGDRVIVRVNSWEKKEHEIVCSLVEKLGHIDDPSCDTEIAMSEFGLRREFPPEVLDEALAFGKRVKPSEIAKRRDLRDRLAITIDPDTAKDFDDAISLEKVGEEYHLGVHIADVAHYVPHGSALDQEARLRCNSTYFPSYCLPMLPSELSNELCSLKPNVNRLTVSVLIRFNSKAELLDYEIVRSVIRSAKRLTYREALSIIEGERSSPYKPLIDRMVELCHKLKERKAERGSVEFSLPEAVVLCDKRGAPQGIDFVEYDITHQMIEEFMVKANEVVATHIGRLQREMIYRIHDSPTLEDLREFFQIAGFFGHQFDGIPSPQRWQQFFAQIAPLPYAAQLASAYIRSMKMAQYSTQNVGHYGLGLENYCHFTSPIRRYSDLTVIRTLFQEAKDEELEQVALNCSDCERNSAKAEQSVTMLKKLRYLKQIHETEGSKRWPALVTRIRPFGINFDLQGLLFEGFIPISELADDYFIYDEAHQSMRARQSGIVLRAGSSIDLELIDVDLILRETQWRLHPEFVEQVSQETLQRRRLRQQERQLNDDGIEPSVDEMSPKRRSTAGKTGSRRRRHRSSKRPDGGIDGPSHSSTSRGRSRQGRKPARK